MTANLGRHPSSLLHVDQSGTVIATTDMNWFDAFGNRLEDWETGLVASGGGWGLHSKSRDPLASMHYMSQRWYAADLGVFASRADLPTWIEHSYAFGLQVPMLFVDPEGRSPYQDRSGVNGYLVTRGATGPPKPSPTGQGCLKASVGGAAALTITAAGVYSCNAAQKGIGGGINPAKPPRGVYKSYIRNPDNTLSDVFVFDRRRSSEELYRISMGELDNSRDVQYNMDGSLYQR